MAVTMEQLQQELAALKAQVDGITAPPTDYYTSRWSGEEIDNGVARALPGGAIDTALGGKSPSLIFGQVPDNDLLAWADKMGYTCAFYVNPTVTTKNVPLVTWYSGFLECNGAGKKITITRADASYPASYISVTSGGVWCPWHEFATTSQLCNPNLLDNWYFVGGGGPGQFPVNQRRQTEYVGAAAYVIDRWWAQFDTRVTCVAGGIMFAGKRDIQQYLPQPLQNETYTLSLLYDSKTGPDDLCIEVGIRDGAALSYTTSGETSGLLSTTFTGAGANKITIGFGGGPDNSARLIAVKLELGSHQTLAHKEGEKCVLNEIPNYAEQLTRCQRYLFVSTPDQRFIGMCEMDSVAGGQGVIWTPVQLRTTPVATGRLSIYGSRNNIDATSLSILGAGPTGVYVTFTCDGLVNTPGSGILYNMDSSAPLVLSAEL